MSLEAEIDVEEVAKPELSELVARQRTGALSPPLASPSLLPFGELAPPIFERLVAEVAWLVDRLDGIRIYGRSGQDQGGLDLVGTRDGELHVYQVRRIAKLDATGLRDAVYDFAHEPNYEPGEKDEPRRFDAVRFVLAAGCSADDTKVEDELARLQGEFQGDLEIELYDASALSISLRERPSIVAGVFGPEWAKAFCGVEVQVPDVDLPNGYELLDDPISALDLSEVHLRAEELSADDPGRAAELFASLANAVWSKFPLHAGDLKRRARDLKVEAGDLDQAFVETCEMLLATPPGASWSPVDLHKLDEIAEGLGESQQALAALIGELSSYVEYPRDAEVDLAPLEALVETDSDFSSILQGIVLRLGELTIALKNIRASPERIAELLGQLNVLSADVETKTRTDCLLADLHDAMDTGESGPFSEVLERAASGYVPEKFAGFVAMRAARSAVANGKIENARHLFRRAVIGSSNAGFGGDAAAALRSISYLDQATIDTLHRAQTLQRSAASVGAGSRLLPDPTSLRARSVESILDQDMREAVPLLRQTILLSRISGSLIDELIARQRYGESLSAAGLHDHAVTELVLAGQRESASKAANALGEWWDPRKYLTEAPDWTIASASAVAARQMDLAPDEEISELAGLFLGITGEEPVEQLAGHQSTRWALAALGAQGDRIPEEVATSIMGMIPVWIDREENHYKLIDQEMVAVLFAIAGSDVAESESAGLAIVEAVKRNVRNADAYLKGLSPSDEITRAVEDLADEQNGNAIETLLAWEVSHPSIDQTAAKWAQRFLKEPVGTDRESFGFGQNLDWGTEFLRMASGEVEIGEATLSDVRVQVIHKLVEWGEDSLDAGGRRGEAIYALARLADFAPPEQQGELFERTMTLVLDPRLNEMDENEIQSQHILSKFSTNTGAANLSTSALVAAAALAKERFEAKLVEDHILSLLLGEDLSAAQQQLVGRALYEIRWALESFGVLTRYRGSHIRRVAAACWSESGRDPIIAQELANDQSRVVRQEIAFALANGEPGCTALEAVLDGLKGDQSYLVRKAASGGTGETNDGSE